MDSWVVFEDLMNTLLPAEGLESYEAGDYSSLDDLEQDLEFFWQEYRREEGLEEFGELDEVFHLEYQGDEILEVTSRDYRMVFGEDLRSRTQRLRGKAQNQPYEARLYRTQHFSLSEDVRVKDFFTGFLKENFDETG